ncbi:MAG: SDR family NAD(P)-dependent oxidoreductase [Gammaproteobacteria bacterium]|nr:SDR family NAD(P)-dependent oxidoreductase [Gammaproteobacteria bacterium]
MDKAPLLLIAGYGNGLGAALAGRFAARGFRVAGLCRSAPPGQGPVAIVPADLTDAADTARAWDEICRLHGVPQVIVHNAVELVTGPFLEQTPAAFRQAWEAAVLSAVHVAQQAFPPMIAAGGGTFLVSGATASIRGGARFAPFAAAKFALRGLAQALAREFQPQGIHVVHVLLDGIIWSERSRRRRPELAAGDCLDPAAIADVYYDLCRQSPAAWTHEIDLRPRNERF